MGVSYTELYGYPKEGGNLFEGGRYIRGLRCSWSDRYALVSELLETAWPYWTGSYAPIAHEYSIEPYPKSRNGGSGSLISYDHALVRIIYDDKVYLFNANSISEELVPWQENMRVSGADMFWKTGSDYYPLTDNEAPIHAEMGYTYILTYHRLYANQVNQSWYDYAGYVNSNVLQAKIMNRIFPADTVLYKAPTMRHIITPGVATPTVTVSLRFDCIYRGGLGWQGAWRPATSQYESIYNSSGTQLLQRPRTVFNI